MTLVALYTFPALTGMALVEPASYLIQVNLLFLAILLLGWSRIYC